MTNPGKNILLLTNIPAPYRIPTFCCLDRLVGGELRVVFCAQREPGRPWTFPADEMDFEWKLLSESETKDSFINEVKTACGMLAFFTKRRPSAVICGGYDTLAAWSAFFWCKLLRRRFVLWLESNARDDRPCGLVRSGLKRFIISNADAIAASGKASAEYVRQLGAQEERIYLARFGGDYETFEREARKVNTLQEKRARGFPLKLILYSGRLIRAKGMFVLLEAFLKVAKELPDAGLLVVGSGPESRAMEEFCQCAGLDRVFFEGPQAYNRMPYYYALADALVLPTFSDSWGFVVNEAFACGVPAIVSRVAGVCEDLILDGETGFMVEPGDVEGLAEKILRVLKDSPSRSRMSFNCRMLIENYSAESCAQGLFAAARGGLRSAATNEEIRPAESARCRITA